MRYSLRHLQIFVAIARTGSVSAAAEALAMSQSAASTALIELERRYDRPLLDRAGRGVKLNEAGRALLAPALEMLDRADEIDRLLAGAGGPGPLRIGATQTIGNYIAPLLIERYRQRHPDAQLSLRIDNTAHIAQAVVGFGIDVALLEGEHADPDLVTSDWIADELVLVCHPGHRLASMLHCSIEDVLSVPWAVREHGSGTRQTLDHALRPYWTRWRIGIELQQIEAILETAVVSDMIGCVSRLAAKASLERGRLIELRVPALDLHRRFYIALHRDRYRTAGMALFLAICAEQRRS